MEHLSIPHPAVVGVVGLFLVWWLFARRPAGLPPGPGFALPLLGHLLIRDPRARFTQWRQQYGDIFSLYIGRRLVIVFNGLSVIREAFLECPGFFSERPRVVATEDLDEGILLATDPKWRTQRTLSTGIHLGLDTGDNQLATKTTEEVIHYIHVLEGYRGAPVDLHRLTVLGVCNIITSVVCGTRYPYDDPSFNRFVDAVEDNWQCLGDAAVLKTSPISKYLKGDFLEDRRILANMKVIRKEFLKPHVDKHKLENKKAKKHAPDFIYAYLDLNKETEQGASITSDCESELLATAGDIIMAATETTSATLSWALLLLLHHPEVQEKCYNEICKVIGKNRLPNVSDRPKMVYLEATIQEVLRKASVGAFAIQHAASRKVTFRGYTIPQGAVILALMTTVLHDQATWGDPQNFRPERFIGNLKQLTRPHAFMPFGIGPRACLGESLARTELFLFLGTLIQRFKFRPAVPKKLPPLEGVLGAVQSPKRYQIRAVFRY